MNIDSLNSNPLLSSSGNHENIQHNQQSEGLDSSGFSATLLEKIGQLESTKGNFNLSNINELHDVAGLLGNFLPTGNKPDKDIDLNNILNEITNASIALEEVKIESNQLEIKLAKLIEEFEVIKTGTPNQTELKEKVEQIIDAISKLQSQKESETKLLDNTEFNNEALVGIEKDNQKEISNTDNLVEQENLVINEIDSSTDLENRIDHLALEIQAIKESLSEKSVTRDSQKRNIHQTDIEHEVHGLQLANQSTTITNELDGTKKLEAIATTTPVQDLNPNYKKDNLLRQSIEEKSLALTTKTETLVSQENTFGKPGQENPFAANKQNGTIENLNLKEMDLGNEKILPRFATDIALLNRAVITENKVGIPPMTKHFSDPEWNKEMGERIVWMHKQAIPSAELRLNPEHLGPIKIKIDLTQDQATVAFTAQHAVVKEAIEASIPKLRELFSAQQLNLSDVNVSQNDSGQKQSKESEQMGGETNSDKPKDESEIVTNENTENTIDIVNEIETGRAIASNGVLSIFA